MDDDLEQPAEALVGVPGLPPLAQLPRQNLPRTDEDMWTAATAGTVLDAGPDLSGPLRTLVVLGIVHAVLLFLLLVATVLR